MPERIDEGYDLRGQGMAAQLTGRDAYEARENLRMVKRAVKGNWELPDGVLQAAFDSAVQILEHGDARTKREALRFLKAVREQNVAGHRIDVTAGRVAQTESGSSDSPEPMTVEAMARMRAEAKRR